MLDTSKVGIAIILILILLLTLGASRDGQLPSGCMPGQIAVATGSGDTYSWLCGDLP